MKSVYRRRRAPRAKPATKIERVPTAPLSAGQPMPRFLTKPLTSTAKVVDPRDHVRFGQPSKGHRA